MKPTSLRRRLVARPTLQWRALERVGMVLRAGSALAAIRQVVTVYPSARDVLRHCAEGPLVVKHPEPFFGPMGAHLKAGIADVPGQ